jgi:hypothetical protein
MRASPFFTRPPRSAAHARCMDLISLALGLGAFALLGALIEGLRRI